MSVFSMFDLYFKLLLERGTVTIYIKGLVRRNGKFCLADHPDISPPIFRVPFQKL